MIHCSQEQAQQHIGQYVRGVQRGAVYVIQNEHGEEGVLINRKQFDFLLSRSTGQQPTPETTSE